MFRWGTVVLVVATVVLVIGAIAFLINRMNTPNVS
jgi:preprotein translocase subunit Sss1